MAWAADAGSRHHSACAAVGGRAVPAPGGILPLAVFQAVQNYAPVFQVHTVGGQRQRFRYAVAGVKQRPAEGPHFGRRVLDGFQERLPLPMVKYLRWPCRSYKFRGICFGLYLSLNNSLRLLFKPARKTGPGQQENRSHCTNAGVGI